MKRVAYVALTAVAVVLSGPAKSEDTRCQWVGATWVCSSTDNSARIPEYSKILQGGRDSVPRYEPHVVSAVPENNEPVDHDQPIDDPMGEFNFDAAIENCKADRQAIIDNDLKRIKGPLFLGKYLPKSQYSMFANVCKAYGLGFLDAAAARK